MARRVSNSGDGDSEPRGGFWSTLRSMSVEPAGFLAAMSMVICYLIFQNLIMQTICQVDIGHPEDRCTEIINKVNASMKTEEREIQVVAAGLSAITAPIFSTITVLVVLFIGPWSDSNGRRIPLLLSLGGLSSFPILSLLCYFLMGKLTALQMSLLVMVPMTVTGGFVVFAMSAYSYLSDTTAAKSRTVRTGVLSAAMRSGTPLGFAVGGVLTRFGVGTVPSLLFASGVALIALLILIFRVKKITPVQKDGTSGEGKKQSPVWIRYNPLTKLVQALAILVQPRPNRHIFWILIICHICYAAPGSGEYSMMYLFVRLRLGWGISNYGFFSMANWLMSAGGVVLSMFVLSKILKISDPWVGFIGGLSQIGGSTLYAFTSTPIMMYAASAIDMMNGTIGVIVRSMLSKAVRADEVGKMFALLGVLESLLPLGMVPIYAMTYTHTNAKFPGAFFFLSAGITLPAEIIFLYFIITKKEYISSPQASKEEEQVPLENGKPSNTMGDENGNGSQLAEAVQLMPSEIYGSRTSILETLHPDTTSDSK